MSKTEYSRLLLKRSTFPGITPTIPTGTTISNTWLTTDVLEGELYLNSADDRLWVRTSNGIQEIAISGISSANYYTTDAYTSGSTIWFNRTDLANAYSVDVASILSSYTGTDIYTTGSTLIGTTLVFDRNDMLSAYTADLSALAVDLNTFVTGFTYNDANTLTIANNNGIDYSATINTMTGLTVNGNLSATTIDTDYIDFNTNYTGATQEGRVNWDSDYGTIDIGLEGGNVQLKAGLDNFYYIKNQSGSTINKGKVVRAAGTLGSSGRILGEYMIADGSIPYFYTLGIAGENILDGEDGYVYEFGLLKGIDTTGSDYSEVWTGGTILYVHPTIPGGLTSVEPTAPNLKIQIAIVIDADSNGSIFIRPSLRSNLGDLHNLQTTGATNGDLISFDSSDNVWKYTKTLTGNYNVNGSLSATTFYGNGSGLTGINDYYVTGGTFSSNTLTLNRQNGSVTITGFTSDIYTTGATLVGNVVEFNRTDSTNAYSVDLSSLVYTGGSGSCISELYTSNIIGCSPLSIYSDASISGYTTGGAYTAKDVNSSGDRLTRTITKSSSGELSELDQQLDRLVYTSDNNAGGLFTSTQKIDYFELNTTNTTSNDTGLVKYEDGVGFEAGMVDSTGTIYKLELNKVQNLLHTTDTGVRSSRLENDLTQNRLITISATSQSSVYTASEQINLDSTDGTNDSYIDITPTLIQSIVTDGSSTSTQEISPSTINTYSTYGSTTSGLEIDPAGNNNGNYLYSTDSANYTFGLYFDNVQFSQTLYDWSNSVNVVSIDGLNNSGEGQLNISATDAIGFVQDTLSLDPANLGSGTKLISTDNSTSEYSEVSVIPSQIQIKSDDLSDSRNITITPTTIQVNGGLAEYDADYSSGYTDRSIVDKGYVDSVAVTNTGSTAGSFGLTIDGGGSAITTGTKGYITIPYNGTITGWDIFADTTGSIVVDVWKDTYANFPPTVADSIAGTEKPTLSSAIKNQDTNLTSWTTSVSAGDIIAFNVDSAATVTRVNLIIYITKS